MDTTSIVIAILALPVPVLVVLLQQRLIGWRVERLRTVAESLRQDDPSKVRIEQHATDAAERLADRLDDRVPPFVVAATYVYFSWLYLVLLGRTLGVFIGRTIGGIDEGVGQLKALGVDHGAALVFVVLFVLGIIVELDPLAVICFGIRILWRGGLKSKVLGRVPSRLMDWMRRHEGYIILAIGVIMFLVWLGFALVILS